MVSFAAPCPPRDGQSARSVGRSVGRSLGQTANYEQSIFGAAYLLSRVHFLSFFLSLLSYPAFYLCPALIRSLARSPARPLFAEYSVQESERADEPAGDIHTIHLHKLPLSTFSSVPGSQTRDCQTQWVAAPRRQAGTQFFFCRQEQAVPGSD